MNNHPTIINIKEDLERFKDLLLYTKMFSLFNYDIGGWGYFCYKVLSYEAPPYKYFTIYNRILSKKQHLLNLQWKSYSKNIHNVLYLWSRLNPFSI